MKITVIGATGKVGALTVKKLLNRGFVVRALVRNPTRALERLGTHDNLELWSGQLDDAGMVRSALTGVDAAFVAMGSIGAEGELQASIIAEAKEAKLPQYFRLSVLNTSTVSLGTNQQAHAKIDYVAETAGIPYTTLRPTIFSSVILDGAREIRETGVWTRLAEHGRVGLIDYRDVADVAATIIEYPDLWGRHWELTGPRLVNWQELVDLLSAELGRTITFRTVDEGTFFELLVEGGVLDIQARRLVTMELALEAGENGRLTENVARLAGHRPRTVEEFLHDNREAFLPSGVN